MSEEDEGLRDWMREWFEQFMGRFDRLDKFMDIMSGRHNVLNGEQSKYYTMPFGRHRGD